MSFPSHDPSHVFRDFVTHGVPSSGAWSPRKPEIRRLLKSYESAIIALIGEQGGNIDLARGVIYFSVTGGTADAIIAEADADLPENPGSAIFIISGIASDNTGPVTINGKPLRTNSGNEIVPGGLTADSVHAFLDLGDHYRLLSDQASASIVAAAEEEANRAQSAAIEASLYDPTFRFKTVADLLASTRLGGGLGTRWQAGDFLYDEAASGALGPDIVENANGVKLRVIASETGIDPRQLGAPANGVDDDAPFVERAFRVSKHVNLGSDATYVFASVIGLPDQTLYADEAHQLTGAGARVILDGVAAGDAIFTSAAAKVDPESTSNIYTGKFNVTGGIQFTQRSQSTLINGDRVYNVRVFGNHFAGIHAIAKSHREKPGHLDGYFQSVFINGNHINDCDWILHGHKGYNVDVSGNFGERNLAGVHLVDANQVFSAHNLRLADNLFEGGGQFLRAGNTIGGVFVGNYLESNTLGDMATAKCNLDLRYANSQPFDNHGTWFFAGNTYQNHSTQVADPDFFDIKIDQGFENVTFGGGDWTNAQITDAPIYNSQGTYSRGLRTKTPFIMPRSTQSAGRDYIQSSLIRPLSTFLSSDKFGYLRLQLGSTYVTAIEYRPFTLDLNVKLELENADEEVFAVASFDAHLLLAPIGSGAFDGAGRSAVWSVTHSVSNLLQQPSGWDIDTATGTKTAQMFPTPANFGDGSIGRTSTYIDVRVAGFVTPSITGRDAPTRVRTHISGWMNGLSRLPGTANHWLGMIN